MMLMLNASIQCSVCGESEELPTLCFDVEQNHEAQKLYIDHKDIQIKKMEFNQHHAEHKIIEKIVPCGNENPIRNAATICNRKLIEENIINYNG